jgi:hypothetical protein
MVKQILIIMLVLFFPIQVFATTAILMYEQFGCGCCSNWEAYIRAEGFSIIKEKKSRADMSNIKLEAGVPMALWSCHTSFTSNLVLEGHVPIDVITDVKNPRIVGFAVPSMRMGSPGMEGSKPLSYDVYAFDKFGNYWFYKSFMGK